MRKPARGATLDEIESIYRTRLPDFRRVAAAILGDRELALDAVQEGFALAVRERSSFRGDGPLEAWLWRIIVNAANPGEPASESDQRAFDAENERTWARFPDGLQLRRVIVTEAAGGTFELFGFRSGYSLCLRLTVEGIPSEGASTGCAPLSELRHAEAPALALYLDAGFGHQDVPGTEEGYVPPRASATFGVVADGVSAVALRTSEGPVETIVENNAFLAVTVDPPLGLRTKELTAIGERGERVSVAIAESPFGDYGPQAKPGVAPGPRAVERRVEGGTVGWLVRREPRGQSLTEAGIERDAFFLRMGTLRYARVLTPDLQSDRRFVLSIVHVPESKPLPFGMSGDFLCRMVFARDVGGGGCSPLADYFSRGPFEVGTSVGHGGEQYALASGVASDDVARMELYLATGERVAVPLADNVYAVEVARTKFPARLVAYDRQGRVIGVENMAHDPLADSGPRPNADKQRIVKRVVGASGTRGTVRVGPSTAGTRCHRISFENGAGGGGCLPKGLKPQLSLGVLNTGSDSFVTGTVADGTSAIELRFPTGERVVVEVVEGVVAHPLTPAQATSGGPEVAIALDSAGKEVGRQRFRRLPQ
ncbi:hypothetical protein BH20ACT14_BH20ACT14_10610 [soil metagenome]